MYARVWWNPLTWFPVGVRVTRESEFDTRTVNSMLAHLAIEADKGPHGIPMSRATAKGAKFVASEIPTHDAAAKALAKAQKAYYDKWPDADRAGDLWSVEEVTD